MKTLIAAATAATLGATAALASGPIAEPIYEPPALLPMPSAYNWTGGYAGVGLTYGRAAMSEGGALPDFPATSGAGIGLLAGYNWQNGNLVYGGEVALDFARRDGANDCGTGGVCESVQNSHYSIRGRVGYAMDRSLAFMTVGYASDRRTVEEVGVGSSSARFSGPMLGVGFEQAVGNAWTARADYEYYFFGDEVLAGNPTDGNMGLFRLSMVRRF